MLNIGIDSFKSVLNGMWNYEFLSNEINIVT